MKNIFKIFNAVSTVFTIVEIAKVSKKYLEDNPKVVKKMADTYDAVVSKTKTVTEKIKNKLNSEDDKDTEVESPYKI